MEEMIKVYDHMNDNKIIELPRCRFADWEYAWSVFRGVDGKAYELVRNFDCEYALVEQ